MASVSEAARSVAVPANTRSRVILASLIGTTVEFYDFYVYATAAVLVFMHTNFKAGGSSAIPGILKSFRGAR